MPAESGAAFVVIQHLAPAHPSQMVELLATHTTVPVSQIEDGVMIQPDHIYVIPPGKWVKIFRGRLFLSDPEKRAPILPIDYFFRSLAEDRRELAIGIALSGTGSDGTLGVRAIKEAGGTVMVQDVESARFTGMPDSAGATGLADYVLPPAEMARELLLFIRHPLVAQMKEAAPKVGETTMQKIVSVIHEQTGIDFTSYKQSTVARRVQRRIGIAQVANPEDYLEFLEQSPQEAAMLGRDLLINVTKFFRDGEVFDVLRGEILPAILNRAAARKALRIWVAGCATGEEAYSIAILVQELVTARGEKWDVKIFATDVDKVSIEHASRGLYPNSIAADVTPELLARFFVQESGALQICPEIRKQVVLCAAEYPARSAVHQGRSDLMPQPAHLSAGRLAEKSDDATPLRAAAWRLSAARHERGDWRPAECFRDRERKDAHLPKTRRLKRLRRGCGEGRPRLLGPRSRIGVSREHVPGQETARKALGKD